MLTRINILFGLSLAIGATVGTVLMTTEVPGSQAVPHDQFGAMLQGGPALVPSRVVVLGWLFGVLQIAVYVTCMTLSVSRSQSPRVRSAGNAAGRGWLYGLFSAGTLLYCGAFTQMVRADRAAAVSGEVSFLGPFPAATSWMLFALWAAPLLFVVAYLCGFSRWIIADEDLSRFEELVARQQREPGTTP
ncbi:MAG: hypothetical protein AB7U20_10795 [Planctomycetaceae bacterium]